MVRPTIVEIDDGGPLGGNVLGFQLHVNREASTTGSLPPGLATPATADLIQTTGRGRAIVTAERKDKRSNVVRLKSLDQLFRKDGASHGRAGVWRDGVDVNVVLGTLKGESAGETKDAAFLQVMIRWRIG